MHTRTLLVAVGFGLAVVIITGGCERRNPVSSFRIASASMAPTWLGPTRLLICSLCGEHIKASVSSSDFSRPPKCFACDGECSLTNEEFPGEVVQVRSVPSESHALSLKRLDCIVYENRDGLAVKRIWGLPGERVEFIDGELWLNSRMYAKSMDELHAVLVPVTRIPTTRSSAWNHYSIVESEKFHTKTLSLSQTLIHLSASSILEWTPLGFTTPEQSVDLDSASTTPTAIEYGVTDDYANNQGLPRSLRLVGDFVVDFHFDSQSEAVLEIGLKSRRDTIRMELLKSANSKQLTDLTNLQFPVHRHVRIAICDGRLLIRSDIEPGDRELPLASVAVKESKAESRSERQPLLEIKVQSGVCELQRLSIARDLYLRKSDRFDEQNFDFGIVPDGHYFVLGDNLPVSIDSRNSEGFIPFDRIQGTVLHENR